MISTDQRRPKKRDAEKFTMHPNWLFDSRLSLMACYVYLVLLSHDWDETGVVWPAVKTIAGKAKISERAVYNALYELRDAGLITLGNRDGAGRHNEYVIHALSQGQIEALCRPEPEADSPLLPADSNLHEVQIQEAEPAPGADSNLHQVQIEPAPGADEVDKGIRRRETDEIRLAGQAAFGGVGEEGCEGISEGVREEAGTTAGSPGLPRTGAGPGDGPGSLAGPGSTNTAPAAHKKNDWTKKVKTESKGERYKRPLDDPEAEFQCSLVTDYALDAMGIPGEKRGANLTSARYLIDDDHKDPAEIRRVIRRVVANSSRWCHVTNLFMVRKHYAEILADADSGTAPKKAEATRDRTQPKTEPKPAADIENSVSEIDMFTGERIKKPPLTAAEVAALRARVEQLSGPQPTPLTAAEVAEMQRARPEERAAIVRRRHLERDRAGTTPK